MEREFSKEKYKKSGKIISNKSNFTEAEIKNAQNILNNWRAIHSYPLTSMRKFLGSKKSNKFSFLITQRLKRLSSIEDKLQRYPEMKLTNMQDIGGIRIIVETKNELDQLFSDLTKNGNQSHSLERVKNYINEPKNDGYRSIHLIYKYNSPNAVYNGLLIEVQLRTKLQHIYATTVETIGVLTNISYKFGETDIRKKWSNFLNLAGATFAALEDKPSVPGYEMIAKEELYIKFITSVNRLKVVDFLKASTIAMDSITQKNHFQNGYHLLILNILEKKIKIKSYSKANYSIAIQDYAKSETQKENIEGKVMTVLVSMESIDSLRKTYPNYFIDTKDFLNKIELIRRKLDPKDKKRGMPFWR